MKLETEKGDIEFECNRYYNELRDSYNIIYFTIDILAVYLSLISSSIYITIQKLYNRTPTICTIDVTPSKGDPI